ncbi:uncharacterized protein LOC133793505 [Humulus lupulus]|uniref:uncharacterized protein LOC133793505 n=1 Tax=Humulus lupulus TaxID=3486 RepID=UPI002B4012B2|nr:uncharacterized protein LOC133793505 [Humulus lupulus]
MGRESHEYPTQVVHSSIALLQERFRELQRVKEMREEKELLRMLSEPKNSTYKQFDMKSLTLTSQSQYYYEPAKLFFQPDLVPQQTPTPQVSLSLWPTFQNSFEEQYHYVSSSFNESPLLMKAWPMIVNSPSFQPSMNKSQDYVDHEADVDTSLHL